MKQKLLKLMCLLCISMMGVSAWGATETLSIDFENAVGNYTSWDISNFAMSASTITAHGGDAFGSTNGKTTGYAQTKDKVVSPLSFTCYFSKTSNNTTASTWYLEVSTDGSNWTEVATQSAISMNKGTWIEFSQDLSSYSNVYVRLRYNGTTAVRAVDDVVLTYSTGDANPKCAAPTFSYESGTILAGTDVEITTTTDGATIYYTTDGTDPSTSSDEYTGAITVNADMTIKAIAVKDGYDNSAIASVSYTVTTPITFNKVTNMNQLLAGNEYIVVCEDCNTAMGAQSGIIRTYGNVTISNNSISVNPTAVAILTLGGSADAWTFLASDNSLYLAWTAGNNLQTSDDETVASAQWIVTDDFTLKNKSDDTRILQYNSTNPRFACYTTSQKAAVLYVKDGSAVAKNVANVAISATALYVDGTATVTTDGPAVTLSTSDASVVSVSGTTVTAVGAGTATVTATWAEDTEFQAGSKEFTITVLRVDGLSEANAFTVAEARAAIDNDYDAEATYYVTGIISTVQSYNATHNSVTYWISDDGTTTNQFECYDGLSFDGDAFTGKDNLTVGDVVTVKGNLYKYNTTYELNSNNELVALKSALTVSASGYATYYNSGLAYTIPTGMTGYAVTAADGVNLTTTEYAAGTVVPAGEALVLKGDAGSYDLVFTTTDATANANNLLKGSDAAETPTAEGRYYMLSYDATGTNVGFYWGTDDGSAFENGAHKAYLLLPSTTSVKGFRLEFDATGITGITEGTEKTESTEGAIYNLAGQRVNSLQKGINIVNGKKVLVK